MAEINGNEIVKVGGPAGTGLNSGSNIDMLMDVSLNVTVELGRTKMALRQILDLQQGSVVELDRLAGEAVDIFVNDRLVAMGEVVVVDDKFGVRITELISKQPK
ncbi:MAG TPA: flagellar motor switch protein FliN [Leptolinea sp.]